MRELLMKSSAFYDVMHWITMVWSSNFEPPIGRKGAVQLDLLEKLRIEINDLFVELLELQNLLKCCSSLKIISKMPLDLLHFAPQSLCPILCIAESATVQSQPDCSNQVTRLIFV